MICGQCKKDKVVGATLQNCLRCSDVQLATVILGIQKLIEELPADNDVRGSLLALLTNVSLFTDTEKVPRAFTQLAAAPLQDGTLLLILKSKAWENVTVLDAQAQAGLAGIIASIATGPNAQAKPGLRAVPDAPPEVDDAPAVIEEKIPCSGCGKTTYTRLENQHDCPVGDCCPDLFADVRANIEATATRAIEPV